MGQRNFYIDFVEFSANIVDGEFFEGIHHTSFNPGGGGSFCPDYPISFFLKSFVNGYNNTSFILP